jgi:hypothetical protein
MHIQPLTYKKFIIGILAIVIIVFIIKLYNTARKNNIDGFDGFDNFENFESILNKLKSNNKRNNNSDSFKKTNNVKLNKKVTFEDLLKESEEMDVEKYTIFNMKKNFFDYVDSFKKEKFKNTSGTTTEALEKFAFFKEKFFQIFI